MKTIYIPGIPDVKMRPRFSRKTGHAYDPNEQQKEASIQKAQVSGDVDEIYTGPLYAFYTFVFPRPKKHYRTGKLAHLLRDDAPEFFDTRDIAKDGDNMEKFYSDSFNYIHYKDDRQIVKAEQFKRWALDGEMPHVEMKIYQVGTEVTIDRYGTVEYLI